VIAIEITGKYMKNNGLLDHVHYGILLNLLIIWLIISKTISLFLDMDGTMSIIWRILSNVVIVSICFLLFRGPSIRELEVAIGKEISGRLKIMAYMSFIILCINIFVGMSTIFSWSVQMILYSVMVLLYVAFTVLQIMTYSKL
jgi:hypothetical protein